MFTFARCKSRLVFFFAVCVYSLCSTYLSEILKRSERSLLIQCVINSKPCDATDGVTRMGAGQRAAISLFEFYFIFKKLFSTQKHAHVPLWPRSALDFRWSVYMHPFYLWDIGCASSHFLLHAPRVLFSNVINLLLAQLISISPHVFSENINKHFHFPFESFPHVCACFTAFACHFPCSHTLSLLNTLFWCFSCLFLNQFLLAAIQRISAYIWVNRFDIHDRILFGEIVCHCSSLFLFSYYKTKTFM